ncbi:MAG: ZIP family metal transporter [Candidatus Odinarchaeia archaeon]
MQVSDPLIWAYTLIAVLIVSVISLIGVFTLAVDKKRLKKIVQYFVSFAAGTLLGGAFIHLIPESFETLPDSYLLVSFSIIAGIVMFFILEKIIQWRHCHIPTSEEHPHSFAYMNLVGDGVHNYIDGLIIAGAFLVNISLGVVTTIAVVLHEIPQEIGDFGVLIHGGFTIKRALLLNFATALIAVLGAISALLLSSFIAGLQVFLVPFAAGGFIYIGASDLIPELNRQTERKEISFTISLAQLFFLVFGILIMSSLLLIG